jgi:cell division protein FtsQ
VDMPEKKVVSLEDRIPKLREARKKRANRRLIFYLSIFFILIMIIIYLQSPLSNVKIIEVNGNSMVPDEKIVEKGEITTKDNIWNIDFDEKENNINEIAEIKNVKIKRKLPNTVEIEVEEFIRVGYVKENSSFFPILENGYVLTEQPLQIPNGDAPILIGWEENTYLTEMTEELSQLHSELASLISEIHWIPSDANPYKVRLYMNDGREVLTSIRNFADKIRAYPSIAAQIDPNAKGYINLDLGAFFVPYDNNEQSNEDEEGENENEG